MTYNDLLSQIDITDVISHYASLVKKGQNYLCICPFHQDSNPSLSISPKRQIFNCFVCGTKGNAISFVEKFEKCSYNEAASKIASLFSIDWNIKTNENNIIRLNQKEEKIQQYNQVALKLFKYNILDKENTQLSNFIKKRELDRKIIDYFEIGYAKKDQIKNHFADNLYNTKDDLVFLSAIGLLSDNFNSDFFSERLIFPIYNNEGILAGFSGRIIDDTPAPKYLNTPENELFQKHRILYNYSKALDYIKTNNEIIICEGYLDVIALYKADYLNAVALMGTNLSLVHIKYFKNIDKNLKVSLFLDNDKAGLEATKKNVEILINNKINVQVINNNYSKDPDEIFHKLGKEKLIEVIENKQSGIEFLYKLFIAEEKRLNNKNNLEELKKTISLFWKSLYSLNQTDQNIYLIKMANDLAIDIEIIRQITKQFTIKSSQTNQEKNLQYKPQEIKQSTKIEKKDNIHLFNRTNDILGNSIEKRYINSIYYIIKNYTEIHNLSDIVNFVVSVELNDISLNKISKLIQKILSNINDQKIDGKDLTKIEQVMESRLKDDKETNQAWESLKKDYQDNISKKDLYFAKDLNSIKEIVKRLSDYQQKINKKNKT